MPPVCPGRNIVSIELWGVCPPLTPPPLRNKSAPGFIASSNLLPKFDGLADEFSPSLAAAAAILLVTANASFAFLMEVASLLFISSISSMPPLLA
ncbi:ORF1131 [White spot syndrome virus]|uniref:ORF1131 n=1 Tax=White spot syndrome virus TaxID=342409 RepID=A0A2D3I5Q0_9VIRU|nr:ORF1131 [White spot syndrome virus]